MSNEEFVASILSRVEQLKVRAHMEWYSKQALEEAFEILKEAILAYTSERPQYKNQMQDQLEYINQVKKDLL